MDVMDRYHAAGKGLARVALFLLMLGLGSISSAQQQASQEEPTFHSATRLVVLDVVVTDQAGKPVTNLPQADFTLLEDGAPQSVASFESPKSRRDTPVSITSKSSKDEAKSAPNDSAPSPSALTILLLDELNSEVLDQAYARSAIQKFLRTHGPRLRQPTSLMLLGEKRLELLHDYNQNANALLEALHQRHAELPFGLMTAELSGASYPLFCRRIEDNWRIPCRHCHIIPPPRYCVRPSKLRARRWRIFDHGRPKPPQYSSLKCRRAPKARWSMPTERQTVHIRPAQYRLLQPQADMSQGSPA